MKNILFKKVEKIEQQELVKEKQTLEKQEQVENEEFISFSQKPIPKEKRMEI